MREGVTSSLQEWLVEKRIDIAIIHNPAPLETLNITPILAERMLVVAPAKGPLKDDLRKSTYRIRDLADLPLILPNMAHNNRRLVEHAAHDHGVRLQIKIEADSVAFAKAMVEKGLGYTILTYAAVRDEVQRKKLVVYPIIRPTLSTKVCMITLRDQQTTKVTQDAGEILHDVCRELVRSKVWGGAQLC